MVRNNLDLEAEQWQMDEEWANRILAEQDHDVACAAVLVGCMLLSALAVIGAIAWWVL